MKRSGIGCFCLLLLTLGQGCETRVRDLEAIDVMKLFFDVHAGASPVAAADRGRSVQPVQGPLDHPI